MVFVSELIIAFAVILFSALGMVYIISKLFDSITWGKEFSNRFTMIIPVYFGTEDVEILLKKAISVRAQSEGDFTIIAVDFDTDDETKKICRIMSENNENIAFMTPEELKLYFVELEQR